MILWLWKALVIAEMETITLKKSWDIFYVLEILLGAEFGCRTGIFTPMSQNALIFKNLLLYIQKSLCSFVVGPLQTTACIQLSRPWQYLNSRESLFDVLCAPTNTKQI